MGVNWKAGRESDAEAGRESDAEILSRSSILISSCHGPARRRNRHLHEVAKIAKPIVETSVKVRQNLEKFVWSSREK
jgi:hypothetical protein